MAAPAGKMVNVSEDSSSDDEVLKRCQEAVWESKVEKNKDGDSILPQSKRVVVADHDHDGNELQVTKGFQTHVAKKLGSFLDNCLTEIQRENAPSVDDTKCDEDDDEGFRLFSSSVPGQKADEPPAPVRRRPVPSSSDSDSEMEARLKEAAVSFRDLLPSLSQPSPLQTPSAEPSITEKKKKKVTEQEEEECHVKKKKKKKRKQNQEQNDSAAPSEEDQNNGEHENSEQEHTGAKVKRKKKKKRELKTTD